ncbi:MAG: ATP-dependent DNA helicase RecG [Oscillospiraceae bacterium]|nr:ATP-dependent DNA helicase RecG [Oscillospiraceae bacterium]
MSFLPEEPVTALPGIGPARAEKLAGLGLTTVGDLLTWYPRDYEDRTRYSTIAGAEPGASVCIPAMVATQPYTAHIRKGLDLVKVKAVDDLGVLEITFFNQSYLRTALHVGETYVFFGRTEGEGRRKRMTNPAFEPQGVGHVTGRIVPIYPLTEGISNNLLTDSIRRALPEPGTALPDPLPDSLRAEHELIDLATAYRWIHAPESWEQLEAARRRLVFEELFFLSIGLCRLKGRRDRAQGPVCRGGRLEDYLTYLPFSFTAAQRRAAEDCARDLASGVPMNRLIQGDVGSGKTAVAAAAVYLTAKSGYQSALMAPTEILAEQHFRTLSELLEPAGIRVALLTGSTRVRARRDLNERLALGMVDLLIGTHALISEQVTIPDLGLVITDEQHRFGVNQRAALTAKGEHPHVLVMSATPIPRTLALMIYGDLDVSVIDELPPGRQPVETFRVHTDKRQRMYGFVRKQVEEGHQVYIVCPSVEETPEQEAQLPGAPELQSVTEYAKTLQTKVFPDLRVDYVHGKMKPKAKEAVMAAFAAGELDILVSTTVIEVGVDVANATLMIVENAERFGLSQLHQLRGRVGRGSAKSWCVLVSDARGETAQTRLKALCSTNDGFLIAEEDLKLRGPGDFFGSRQHGLPQLKVADLAGDTRVLQEAQQAARELLARDPDLEEPENRPVKARVIALFEDSPDIFN